MRKNYSRRDFLKASAAAAAPMIVPATVFGTQDKAAPSNRLGVGHIGVGTMGYNHVKGNLGYADVQVLAVCDVDKDRREFNQKTVEKGYSKDSTYKGCAAYNDFRELLARKDIDAVVIATPDHWHAIRRARGLQGQQGHLLREAAVADHPRGQDPDRRGPQARARLPDRQPAALREGRSARPCE